MSANDLLNLYEESISIISIPTPENINRIIINDNGCLRQLGKGIYDSSYACKYCDLIGNLIDLREGYPSIIHIKAGQLKDKDIIIEDYPKALMKAKYDPRVLKRYRDYENAFSGNIAIKKIITVDMWVNNVVIGWLIQLIYKEVNINHSLPTLGIFTCRNTNYILRINDYYQLTRLDLNEDIVLSIIQQLGCALRIVRNQQLVQPYATISSLYYNTKTIQYNYHNIKINSPFTLILGNFSTASLEWGATRLVPYSRGSGIDIERTIHSYTQLTTLLHQVTDISNNIKQNELFKIYPDRINNFMAMRLSGYPIYPGVYEFYSFIASLLSWKEFYNIINSSERLQIFFNNIFPRKNITMYWNYTQDTPITCPYEITKQLSNFYLYTDVLDRFLTA